jgi:NAD-dependent dihydropyrimidine dehydrogenase PreA subunit
VFALSEKKAFIENFNACMECGACMVNCPAEAIFVDAGVGCAAGIITQWLRDFTAGSKRAEKFYFT